MHHCCVHTAVAILLGEVDVILRRKARAREVNVGLLYCQRRRGGVIIRNQDASTQLRTRCNQKMRCTEWRCCLPVARELSPADATSASAVQIGGIFWTAHTQLREFLQPDTTKTCAIYQDRRFFYKHLWENEMRLPSLAVVFSCWHLQTISLSSRTGTPIVTTALVEGTIDHGCRADKIQARDAGISP